MFMDNETGEYVNNTVYPTKQPLKYDMETGEPDCTQYQQTGYRKVRFNVPRGLLGYPEPKKRYPEPKKDCTEPIESYSLFNRGRVIEMHENIVHGKLQTSYRLFVIIITAMYLLTRHVAVASVLLEFAMHGWAHHKNLYNTDPLVYHRSPLHVFTSMFCASCRRESAMNQVIKLQDKRQQLWQLKYVARNIY